MTRVSVDKAALDEFIKSFRFNARDLSAEFIPRAQADIAGDEETAEAVSALDIKEAA